MSWGFGPMCILLFGMLFAPGGYLFDVVQTISSWFMDTSGYDVAASAIASLDSAGVDVSKLHSVDDAMKQMTAAGLSYDPATFKSAYHVYVNANVFSSRMVFLTLFIVAFIAWNLQRKLDESSEWKASKAAAKAKGEDTSLMHAFKVLFTNKIAVRTVIFLATIYLTWNLVASVMGFFQPHIYETAGGVSNEQSNWMNCIQWAIIVGVTFIVSKLIDKTSHKGIYVFGLVVAIAAWVVIVTVGVNGLFGLWLFTILWGIQGGASPQIFYALWGSELFPAKFRAGAQGLMFFIVRGLSAVWGLVFTLIYGEKGEGFTIAAYCMIALLLISLIVGFIGCPKTRGRSLDSIARERYGEDY